MFQKLAHFFAYHNAVPILFGILFLGATGVAAASPDVREQVFSSEQTLVSVDNSRIVNADLANFPFSVQVVAVREDGNTYYVSYTLQTIALREDVWRDVTEERMLTVAKDALRGGDLGLYATKEIAEVRMAEKARLIETQKIERAIGGTQKVVSTEYSGLVGRFLDPTSETLPGYQPVIVPPPEPIAQVVVSATIPQNTTETPQLSTPTQEEISQKSEVESSTVVPDGKTTLAGDPSDTVPPSITILGNNPARIAKGSSYVDLGCLVTDDKTLNIGATILLNGKSITTINIDTSVVGVHTIMYRTADQAGNTTEATRIVEIYNPYAPVESTEGELETP